MESQSHLGIYIDKDTATVVCLSAKAKEVRVLGCFSVTAADKEQPTFQTLANLIAEGCAQRQWRFVDVALAMDCALFMQHSVHSQFKDQKQIAATVKFDTEEALATDISTVGLAFEVTSSDQTGSKLTVFTAERKILTDILSALQQYGIDPITMEPDVCCLSRFLNRRISPSGPQESRSLFALLSRRSGYLIIPPLAAEEASGKTSIARTFLVGAARDRTTLLAREALITTALVENTQSVANVHAFDSAGTLDSEQLSQRLARQVDAIDLHHAAGVEPQALNDCLSPVDFVIACGAALIHSDKANRVDFRSDFSPFQGKTLRLQKALKFTAVSLVILLIAVGLYFQTQLFSVNKGMAKMRSKFAKDYTDVTLEKLSSTTTTRKAVLDIKALLRRIEAEKKGLIADKTSVSSRLTLVLAAFVKCAAPTDLNVTSITITTKGIDVSGDTSSRQNRQKIFDTIREGGLDILGERYEFKNGREYFTLMLAPKT